MYLVILNSGLKSSYLAFTDFTVLCVDSGHIFNRIDSGLPSCVASSAQELILQQGMACCVSCRL